MGSPVRLRMAAKTVDAQRLTERGVRDALELRAGTRVGDRATVGPLAELRQARSQQQQRAYRVRWVHALERWAVLERLGDALAQPLDLVGLYSCHGMCPRFGLRRLCRLDSNQHPRD